MISGKKDFIEKYSDRDAKVETELNLDNFCKLEYRKDCPITAMISRRKIPQSKMIFYRACFLFDSSGYSPNMGIQPAYNFELCSLDYKDIHDYVLEVMAGDWTAFWQASSCYVDTRAPYIDIEEDLIAEMESLKDNTERNKEVKKTEPEEDKVMMMVEI